MHTNIQHSVVRYNIPESDKTFFKKHSGGCTPQADSPEQIM
jgi:hypothetical protein